jgi:hypothetical protein
MSSRALQRAGALATVLRRQRRYYKIDPALA